MMENPRKGVPSFPSVLLMHILTFASTWLVPRPSQTQYLWVHSENLECLLHLVLAGPAPNIQEVGRLSFVQLDDVHGCHGETSTIHCMKPATKNIYIYSPQTNTCMQYAIMYMYIHAGTLDIQVLSFLGEWGWEVGGGVKRQKRHRTKFNAKYF